MGFLVRLALVLDRLLTLLAALLDVLVHFLLAVPVLGELGALVFLGFVRRFTLVLLLPLSCSQLLFNLESARESAIVRSLNNVVVKMK